MKQRDKRDVGRIIDAIEVRVALLRSGRSIRSWARDCGFNNVAVIRAMRGQRGPKHDLVRRMLVDEFGVGK